MRRKCVPQIIKPEIRDPGRQHLPKPLALVALHELRGDRPQPHSAEERPNTRMLFYPWTRHMGQVVYQYGKHSSETESMDYP